MSKDPCPNCHSSHASHYVGDEEFRCALCQTDCRASVARQATLGSLLTTRFRELLELVAAYKELVQLRSPIRTMLLSRMRGCLDDVARIEGLDPASLPEANLDRYECIEFDEDEDERTAT